MSEQNALLIVFFPEIGQDVDSLACGGFFEICFANGAFWIKVIISYYQSSLPLIKKYLSNVNTRHQDYNNQFSLMLYRRLQWCKLRKVSRSIYMNIRYCSNTITTCQSYVAWPRVPRDCTLYAFSMHSRFNVNYIGICTFGTQYQVKWYHDN